MQSPVTLTNMWRYQTSRQADRQAGRQTDGWTDRQADTHTQTGEHQMDKHECLHAAELNSNAVWGKHEF